MSFSLETKTKAFNACARHCCVCHRYKGVKMELHHINPKRLLGKDSFENAVPLCFDCHCDAGHYFAKHPKGSKYSPKELKNARDKWYKYVKENPITEKIEISDNLQTTYYVLHAFDLANDILNNKDFSSINLYKNQVYLMENHVSEFWKAILLSQNNLSSTLDQQLIYNHELFDSVEEYLEKYQGAEIVDKTSAESPYYEASRRVSWDEFKDNAFMNLISKTGVDINKVCKSVLFHDTGECEGSPSFKFQECISVEPVSFVFIGITNVSESPLKLNELTCKDQKYALPEFNLGSKEMILIPISTNYGLKEFNHHSVNLNYKSGDRMESISRVLNPDISLEQKDTFLSPYITPVSISFNNNSGAFEIPVHKINFNNLYSVTRSWQCGSCPHLFLKGENGIQYYQKEILTEFNNNTSGEEIISVPNNVVGIYIRELEDETTIIDSIHVNDIEVMHKESLSKGESLYVKVHGGDIVSIKGRYIPNYEPKKSLNDLWYRNKWISESNRDYNNLV